MSLEVLEVLDELETPRREAELLNFLYYSNYSIAFPYLIGCKRGGGDWNKIYGMIEEILGDCDVTIYEHDLG